MIKDSKYNDSTNKYLIIIEFVWNPSTLSKLMSEINGVIEISLLLLKSKNGWEKLIIYSSNSRFR